MLSTRPPSSQVMAPQPTDTDFRQNDRRQDYGLKVWHKMKYTDVKQAKARAADNTTASLIPTEHAQGCKMCFCVGFPCPYCVYLCEGEKLNQDNLVLCHCLFGVPLPPCVVPCLNLTWAGLDSWHTIGEQGEVNMMYVLVDKKAGVINSYPQDQKCDRRWCGDEEKACCTLVPFTSLTTKVDGIGSFPAPQS